MLRGILDSFTNTLNNDIRRKNEVAPIWFQKQPTIPLEPEIICNKDMIDGYRNKVEFTVGREYSATNDGEIVVGFNRGNLAKGIIFVDRGDTIKVNSAESVQVAKQFEVIVKASGLEPFDR